MGHWLAFEEVSEPTAVIESAFCSFLKFLIRVSISFSAARESSWSCDSLCNTTAKDRAASGNDAFSDIA